MAKLVEMHPVGPPIAPLNTEMPSAWDFVDKEVKSALESFPRDAVGGGSGLAPQHLRDAVCCPSPVLAEQALIALVWVVNVLHSGEAPEGLAPFMAGAPLTALKKEAKEGELGVRPIAVGETIRRLVSKCSMRHEEVKDHAGELFLPDQVGVCVSRTGLWRLRIVFELWWESWAMMRTGLY